jgi:hypothetical protein
LIKQRELEVVDRAYFNYVQHPFIKYIERPYYGYTEQPKKRAENYMNE